MGKIKYLQVQVLRKFMVNVFIKLGVPPKDARICADVLISSDLKGIETHGVNRLGMYVRRIKKGIQRPFTKIQVIKDKKGIAVWDGNHGMGQVIAHHAMIKAIEKAEEYGIGCVVVRNSTHFGIAGYYTEMAAQSNMIGISCTNARPSVTPLFGVTPTFGTNPLSFAAPSDLAYPFIYYAATSIVQRGKIEVNARINKKVPEKLVIDKQGDPLTEPREILSKILSKTASFLALGGNSEEMGGHKGYGLATIIEILSSALQQGYFLGHLSGVRNGKNVHHCLGHFFMAINIEMFTEIENFKKTVGNILRGMKNAKLAPGHRKIYVAGEKEYLNALRIREEGIPVNQNLMEELFNIQDELAIAKPIY